MQALCVQNDTAVIFEEDLIDCLEIQTVTADKFISPKTCKCNNTKCCAASMANVKASKIALCKNVQVITGNISAHGKICHGFPLSRTVFIGQVTFDEY